MLWAHKKKSQNGIKSISKILYCIYALKYRSIASDSRICLFVARAPASARAPFRRRRVLAVMMGLAAAAAGLPLAVALVVLELLARLHTVR